MIPPIHFSNQSQSQLLLCQLATHLSLCIRKAPCKWINRRHLDTTTKPTTVTFFSQAKWNIHKAIKVYSYYKIWKIRHVRHTHTFSSAQRNIKISVSVDSSTLYCIFSMQKWHYFSFMLIGSSIISVPPWVYMQVMCVQKSAKRGEKIQKLGFQLKKGYIYIYIYDAYQIEVPSFLFVLQAIVHVQIKYNITFIKLRPKNKSTNAIDI